MEIQLRQWFYYISFADVVVIIKQQAGSMRIGLYLGADYPGRWRKLPKYGSKNKLSLQLKQRTIIIFYIAVTIVINKIGTFCMFSSEKQGIGAWNFRWWSEKYNYSYGTKIAITLKKSNRIKPCFFNSVSYCNKGKVIKQWKDAEILMSRKLNSYSNAKQFYIPLSHAHFCFFEVMSVHPIYQYQNTTPRAMSLHELKKVQLQECFTLMTHDSIGHLKMLCMSIYH